MGDVDPELLKLVNELKAEFKRFKRRFTPILKKYEEYIFNKSRKFSERDIRLIIVGSEDDGLKGKSREKDYINLKI